ncbi:MAG TPA: NAD-dependent epimerase/dehydratase family protein, partial [Bacteroidales bacterium]|nr:NAD-dependent epimerase/dehydratase family protein [Bacteroidales bacterium]
MANILVTGGAGFIGSHLTNRLMSLGHNVMVVDNLSTGSLRNVPKNVIFVNADISNLDRLSCVFNSCSFDFIYHLAAQTNLRKSFTDSVFDAQTNIIGMLNLLKISPFIMNPQGKFIFVSTGGAIYSPDAPLPWTEQSNTFPPSPYGISKLSAEHYVTQLTNNNC